MKQFISLSGPRLQMAVIICGISFAFFSCNDKVDKTLDKVEHVIDKYEQKLEDNDFTYADRTEMSDPLEEIEKDFEVNVGKEQELWTEEQRARSVRLGARMQQIKRTARRNGYY